MSEKLEKKVKKNNSGIIILSILLVLVILIFAFYVLFDQGIIKLGGAKVEEEVKEEVVEVNVKSRLVNYLYNSVANASDGNDWYRFWRYQNGFTDQLVDFYSKSAPEKVKMQLVAKIFPKGVHRYGD
jgi:preprotein translocase subunit SecF